MKTLVVYDSAYGNTEKVAQAIADALAASGEVTKSQVGEVNPLALAAIGLLIVGSPTQGGRPTPAMQAFLNKIPANALKNVGVTAFDTRFSAQSKGIGMRLLLKFVGYAAGRIADRLQAKGGYLTIPPEGFIVEGKEGPLKPGELARAAAWAIRILPQRQPSPSGMGQAGHAL